MATPDAVPADYFLGTSFSLALPSMFQFAWPLFHAAPDDFAMANALAAGYRPAADGLAHTITLRDGLQFHDGSPIDGRAVAENLRSYFFADHPLRDSGPYEIVPAAFGTPPAIDRVDEVDELTVRIRLRTPVIDIREPLFQMPILSPAVLARPDYGTDPGALRDGGSGPFRLTAFRPSAHVEFERFDGFFEDVLLDRLRYELIADPAARALAVRGGQVDIALEVPQADQQQLAADPAFQAHVSAAGNSVFLQFLTLTKPELQDRRVREAIWLAMNRDAYRQSFFNAAAPVPSTQPVVVPGVRGHDPDLTARPHDPARARALLAEAGVSDLRLSIITGEASGPILSLPRLHEAIAADLAEVGIEVALRVADDATVAAEYLRHDYVVWWFGNGFNADFLFRLFYLGYPQPWKPPDPRATAEIRELASHASASVDLADQEESWRRLQRIHHDELIMGIPIADVGSSAISRRHVHGLDLNWFTVSNLVWIYRTVWVGQ